MPAMTDMYGDVTSKNEVAHVEEIPSGIGLTDTALYEAKQDALSAGQPKLEIIRNNMRTSLVTVVTQVSHHLQ